MKTVFISSPYTCGDTGDNVGVQLDTLHDLMDLGYCPIAPLLFHFAHIHRPRPYEEWLAVSTELSKRADGILRLPGFSPGADHEVREFRSVSSGPVFYSLDSLEVADVV